MQPGAREEGRGRRASGSSADHSNVRRAVHVKLAMDHRESATDLT
jgi:hypothetical protein